MLSFTTSQEKGKEDGAQIPQMDRLCRFEVGDIVKLKVGTSIGNPKSSYTLIEEVVINSKGILKLHGPCFEKKRLPTGGPRLKYEDSEPSGILYRDPNTHEFCMRNQKSDSFDLIWSTSSGEAKSEWYDAAFHDMTDDRKRKVDKKKNLKEQVGLSKEEDEDADISIDDEKGIKIMQWNQKTLTSKHADEKDFDKEKRHSQRTKNIYETIRSERPAVVVMQEVTRKGEETIADICKKLNNYNVKLSGRGKNAYGGTDETNWAWGVSEPVDKRLMTPHAYDKGDEYGSEIYAVIYQKSIMGSVQGRYNDDGTKAKVANEESHVGQVLFKQGFAPPAPLGGRLRSVATEDGGRDVEPVETIYFCDSNRGWHAADSDPEPEPVKVSVDIRRVTDVYERAARIKGGVRGRFLHRPALFHFPHSRLGPISILSNHLTASETPVSMQNLMESVYVQHIVTELRAKFGRQIILLGDFNVSQTNNEAMWNDDELPGIVDDGEEGEDGDDDDEDENSEEGERFLTYFDRHALLQPIRDDFRALYHRAFSEEISTNVFPFLGSLTAEPAHNDDIWLPIAAGKERREREDKLTNISPDGRIHTTKLVSVPANILNAWSKESSVYEVVKRNSGDEKKVPRLRITQRLAYLWSDHKPLCVRVWLKTQ